MEHETPLPTRNGPTRETGAAPPRPEISAVAAHSLARGLFGFAGTVHELPSERGRNFRVDAPGGERRVLKVTWDEPSRAFVELETRVLSRAASAGLPVPRLWPSRAGDPIADATDELGRPC